MIILASNSPRRKELMEKYGLSFQVVPSLYEEKPNYSLSPIDLVSDLAYNKAKEVASRYPMDFVIGADTVVAIDGEILGKPKDALDSFQMLKKLSGKMHSVFTGVCFIGKETKKIAVESKVYFKELTDEEILDYVKTDEPLDKAGSYAIQGIGKKLVSRYEGSYENIIGLPMDEVIQELKRNKLIE